MSPSLKILNNKKAPALPETADQKPVIVKYGAVKRTRTSTVLLPLAPEASASANSAMTAYLVSYIS